MAALVVAAAAAAAAGHGCVRDIDGAFTHV
jgi:hypothetical protein